MSQQLEEHQPSLFELPNAHTDWTELTDMIIFPKDKLHNYVDVLMQLYPWTVLIGVTEWLEVFVTPFVYNWCKLNVVTALLSLYHCFLELQVLADSIITIDVFVSLISNEYWENSDHHEGWYYITWFVTINGSYEWYKSSSSADKADTIVEKEEDGSKALIQFSDEYTKKNLLIHEINWLRSRINTCYKLL